MDYSNGFGNETGYQGATFGSVTGKIVEIMPHGVRGLNSDGCSILVTVEAEENDITNFVVNPTTYVVDYLMLEVGMECTFWYALNVPAILIYPPQYPAVVVARVEENRQVEVAHFDEELVNEKNTLKLNLLENQIIYTTNGQRFLGDASEQNLVVEYCFSTRSIPAQTTPDKVVVLSCCNM